MAPEFQALVDTPRNVKLLHQVLCITDINFATKTLFGFTDMVIVPMVPQLRSVVFNCSNQIDVRRVTVQDSLDAAFTHESSWAMNIHPCTWSVNSLSDLFSKAASAVDADQGKGELLVSLPPEIWQTVDELKVIRVGIDFRLENPTVGCNFVCPVLPSDMPSTSSSSDGLANSHVYSWKRAEYEARAWFPCIDVPSELCTWKIEVTCDRSFIAVCSGDLMGVGNTNGRDTYSYQVTIPTPACNIGFAVGHFKLFVHPEMNELSNFCPPDLLPLLSHTCKKLHKAFEFFEELLSFRYPYSSYKLVFVNDIPEDMISYLSLTLMDVRFLHHKTIIEQEPVVRSLMARAVAQQFFGCYVMPYNWKDRWLAWGAADYISRLYVQRFFGNNEYLYTIYELLNDVTHYEKKFGGIVLSGPKGQRTASGFYFDPLNPFTCSPLYVEMLVKKASLVFRMLEKKLGKELFFQVLNKLLTVGAHVTQQRYQPSAWLNMLLSTDSFLKCVSNVTGQDLQNFFDQWVDQGGHVQFSVSFSFNRKRNMIELELKQNDSAKGSVKYLGPVTVVVQELDGSFSHTLQIDDVVSKHDIQCHSKARRQRKRKIPLWTGEEVDMDLSALDPDSPVLWLWLDPDMVTISSIDVQQPDYQWQYQVRYERNVIAQLEALHVLPNFCSLQTHVAILDVIENEQYYYRVRCAACHCLAKVANKLITALTGPPALILLFRKMFGSKSCATIPRQNNFSNLQQYFVMLAIISSIAELRGPNGKCLMDTCIFLLDLLKYNDNSQNKYSDDCYRATLVDALGRVVGMPESASFLHFFQSPTASASDLFEGGAGGVPEVASNLVRRMLNTLLTQLSLDVLRPSYGRVVTWKCLEALMQFYISRVITCDFEIWLKFAACGNFSATRVRAAGCLVRLLKVTKDVGLFSKLLDLLDDKHDTAFRYRVIRLLCDHPPFTPKERVGNPLYCKDTFDRLCSMFIDIGPFADFWFHGALLDFIFLTFDRDRQLFLNLTSIHPPEAMLNRSAIAVTNESTL